MMTLEIGPRLQLLLGLVGIWGGMLYLLVHWWYVTGGTGRLK